MNTEKKTVESSDLWLLSPLCVGVFDQEYGGSPECLYDSPIEYENDIREALHEFLRKVYSGNDLMACFSLPDAREMEAAIRSKVRSACLDVRVIDERLYAAVKVETSVDLTEEELDALAEQVEIQYRDGWGSAFNLEKIPTSQGDLIYASPYYYGFELCVESADHLSMQPAVDQGPKTNFFEQELQKIVGPLHPDATFVGQACYVRLDELNRAKIQFVSCGVAGEYPALGVTILNRQAGEVDQITLRFGDILGWHENPSANAPFAWDCEGGAEWYGFQPSQEEYRTISNALERYLEVFQEQTPSAAPQWQPAMQ